MSSNNEIPKRENFEDVDAASRGPAGLIQSPQQTPNVKDETPGEDKRQTSAVRTSGVKAGTSRTSFHDIFSNPYNIDYLIISLEEIKVPTAVRVEHDRKLTVLRKPC